MLMVIRLSRTGWWGERGGGAAVRVPVPELLWLERLPLLNQGNETLPLSFRRPINYHLGGTQTYKHFVMYSNIKGLLTRTLVGELMRIKAGKCKCPGLPCEVRLPNLSLSAHNGFPRNANPIKQAANVSALQTSKSTKSLSGVSMSRPPSGNCF